MIRVKVGNQNGVNLRRPDSDLGKTGGSPGPGINQDAEPVTGNKDSGATPCGGGH